MQQLTALVLTVTGIAEIRALEYVAIGALGSSLAIAVESEIAANRIILGMFSMNVQTRVIVTFAVGKMQTQRCTLLSSLVHKITSIALGAVVLEQPVAADGDFGGVMDISTVGALDT